MKKLLVNILTYCVFGSSVALATESQLYTETSMPQEYCMALNIYHEARSDNLAGKYAVGDVVLNRVRDRRYPDTVCEVVYQAQMKPSWKNPDVLIPVRHRCQFSWYCDGKDDTPKDDVAWLEAQEIAYMLMHTQNFVGISEGSTHYHATYVDPIWNRRMQHVGRIGDHLFFRQP